MTSPGTPTSSIEACPWCGSPTEHGQLSCPRCGGALQLRPRKDDSGWVELPPIANLSRLRLGKSTCQIEGDYVPVCDFNLAAGDSIYFAHHTLLWRDPAVKVGIRSTSGMLSRLLGGMSLVLAEATGPGHIAFSADHAGEVIAIPLAPGQSIHVREHTFLAATANTAYQPRLCGVYFTTISSDGKDRETHYPIGRHLDEFSASAEPGLLLVHGAGNVFIRQLAEGESLLIQPTAFVLKDPSVGMGLCNDSVAVGWGYQNYIWMELRGPGKVAVQSVFPPVEGANGQIFETSGRVSASVFPRASASPTLAVSRQPSTLSPVLQASYRMELEKMIRMEMVDGMFPPGAMERIEREAQKHRLTPYDVQLVVRHVRTQAAQSGRTGQ